MYGPSGPSKLCYRHHMEAGGKPSPFAKRKAASSTSAPEAKTKTKKKVIRRRKGEQRDEAASAGPTLRLEASENPPLSAKDEGLRRVEARLARKKS